MASELTPEVLDKIEDNAQREGHGVCLYIRDLGALIAAARENAELKRRLAEREDDLRRLRNEVSDACANILTDTPESFGELVKESPERLLDLVTCKVDECEAKIARLTELLRGAEYYIKPLAQNELLRANIAAALSSKEQGE